MRLIFAVIMIALFAEETNFAFGFENAHCIKVIQILC